jgi:hypothetical protein
MTDTNATPTDTSKRPLVERRYEGKPKPPKEPHTVHMRELLMADGRRLLLDRRSIAFLVEAKPEEFGGKRITIVAFKTQARACPVAAGYDDLKSWWRGEVANGKPAQ